MGEEEEFWERIGIRSFDYIHSNRLTVTATMKLLATMNLDECGGCSYLDGVGSGYSGNCQRTANMGPSSDAVHG